MTVFGGKRRQAAPQPEVPAWMRTFFMDGTEPARGTPEYEEYLLARFFCQPDPSGRDLVRAAWEKHGRALTAEYAAANPGRRPWYWWLVEIADDFDDGPMLDGKESQADYHARLSQHEAESDAALLRRRGRLLPGELKRIPPEAFEPEPLEPDGAA